ncbi:fructosamine kinase family protein [Amphritea pacifica]|uniref:fructosamine kinase family protein n=1 Tax=Amphritea pacifica TaxID=2811233 RepID=UPI001964829A|nr:fructosamine kinase family protein [Amphritea pacifica]MBN1006206.1 fructosamine kinase family protein [Amphritea pacifica]
MPDLLPEPIVKWIKQQSLQLISAQALTGGCVADIRKLTLHSRQGYCLELVLKQMPGGSAEQLAAEASGLQTLRLPDDAALRVPEVVWQEGNCLLLEYLPAAAPAEDFAVQLGIGLALQHRSGSVNRTFGFDTDTFCGGTRQPNRWQVDGTVFYAQQRYQVLAEQNLQRNRISPRLFEMILRLSDRLSELVPCQPAVLLHGDLWSGNVICGPGGEPALIDPAVYYGWAEAELAMTRMFGGFSERFYQVYEAHSAVLPDWRDRVELYNLYHYLNHLLLFGSGYHRDVERIVKYYSG